jgi:hypothetical protein
VMISSRHPDEPKGRRRDRPKVHSAPCAGGGVWPGGGSRCRTASGPRSATRSSQDRQQDGVDLNPIRPDGPMAEQAQETTGIANRSICPAHLVRAFSPIHTDLRSRAQPVASPWVGRRGRRERGLDLSQLCATRA